MARCFQTSGKDRGRWRTIKAAEVLDGSGGRFVGLDSSNDIVVISASNTSQTIIGWAQLKDRESETETIGDSGEDRFVVEDLDAEFLLPCADSSDYDDLVEMQNYGLTVTDDRQYINPSETDGPIVVVKKDCDGDPSLHARVRLHPTALGK